jgi:hypothetical protein
MLFSNQSVLSLASANNNNEVPKRRDASRNANGYTHDSIESPLNPHKKISKARMCSALVLAVLIGLFALEFLSAKSTRVTTCGNSSDHAAALGCKFDIMSFSWLPVDCYDEELSTEFDQLQRWEWFSDYRDLESSVRAEDVRQGKFDHLFVTQEYHFHHCAFMWRKLHRAAMGIHSVDSYIWNYRHTEHCSNMLLLGNITTVNTKIVTKFPRCCTFRSKAECTLDS